MGAKEAVGRSFFQEPQFRKYFLWAVVAVLLVLSFMVVRDYVVALITAFILAYLINPIHRRLKKKVGNKTSALLIVLLVLVILVVPVGLVLGGVAEQTHRYFVGGGFSSLVDRIGDYPLLGKIGSDLGFFSNSGESFSFAPLISFFGSAVSHVPSFFVSLFIVLFGIYFILTGWDSLSKSLKNYIPFRNRDDVADEISEITNTIVYGTFLMALIEFVVAALGFYLLGIEFYLLLAILIFFFAFIPALGPTIVWIPMLIYFLVIGNYLSAVGVLIIGLILSTVIDTVLRAKVLGDRSRINPLVMIVGIFGGISVFGVFGFVIGPLVLLYTLEILQEVMSER